MSKYVRDEAHCKHASFTKEEIETLIETEKVKNTSELTNDSDFVVDANYVHTDNNYTTEEKDLLNSIGTQKVLWSGGWHMVDTHTVNLTEPVSKQQNGIVLVFAAFVDGAVQSYHYHYFFVPKYFVETYPGVNSQYTMATSIFDNICTKTLYISDETITGHARNNATGTSSGITYNNKYWALAYVLGV